MNLQNKLDLRGNLNRHPLAELLVEISQARLNGTLRLENSAQKIVIYFDGGDLVFAASNSRKHKLFEILLREKKISPQQLSAIENFTNDLILKENLLVLNLLSKEEVKELFARQFSMILQEGVVWNTGGWVFTPLARVREEAHQPFDFHQLLFEFGRNLSGTQAAQRLRSFDEIFRVRKNQPNINLQPEEAFILSRFENRSLTVEEIRDLSGLSETDTFRIIYGLWLGGFLVRENWTAAFSPEKLNVINSAKLQVKMTNDMPEIKVSAVQPPLKEKVNDEKKPEEHPEAQEEKFTLEDYLEQVREAENYYEIFDISSDASIAEIKKTYFSFAKRFHPDLFYKKVESDKHKEIQDAFTSIAQAYETLRNAETREVYDYKMRKTLEYGSQKSKSDASATGKKAEENEIRAAEFFEYGFSLLMDEKFDLALSYLANAVNLVGDNAKYRAYYGRALAANGKNHQAAAELQTAVRLEKENLDYRLMLAKLFIDIGLLKRAEGELKRLLDIAPNNYEAQTLLDSLPVK